MTGNLHIRNGMGSVRPYLHGPLSLPAFLQQTFDAVEIERNDFSLHSRQVELKIGDSVVVIEAGVLPPGVAPWTGSIYVYVKDVDCVFRKAIELGAKAVMQPQDRPFKERQAGFLDAAGNTWWIATYIP